MLNLFWAFFTIFAFGASASHACDGHFFSSDSGETKVQAMNSAEGDQPNESSDDKTPEHCCQIHLHFGTLPESIRIVTDAPAKAASTAHFLFYTDPALIQNTRPPLAG